MHRHRLDVAVGGDGFLGGTGVLRPGPQVVEVNT